MGVPTAVRAHLLAICMSPMYCFATKCCRVFSTAYTERPLFKSRDGSSVDRESPLLLWKPMIQYFVGEVGGTCSMQ